MNKNIKLGVILSYILLLCNTFYGLLITPFILNYVGDSSYGVYKSVASLSASFAVMDLGLGGTMTRYMAKFAARGEKEKAENFFAMLMVQFSVIATAILIVCFVIYFGTDTVFGKSFNAAEIVLAKRLVLLLFLNMVLRLFENLMTGALNGYEQYVISNGLKLGGVVAKFTLILVVLPLVGDVTLIVSLDCVLCVLIIICALICIISRLQIHPKLKYWDMDLFKESFGYTALMFVQTITVQFNGNVDNVLIGSFMGASSVTVYSMALVIFSMYESLSGSIANIMLPQMARHVEGNQSSEKIQQDVEQAGRVQFILLAAAMGGFIVLGKDFFNLWLGKEFNDCYLLTLILIIPVTFPMVQNVALSVLRAQNRMLYRTVTLALSCLLNIVITIIGIRLIGYWGAAAGTAIATISNLVFMNYYYKTRLFFSIGKLFYHIMKGILQSAMIAIGCSSLSHLFIHEGWSGFAINATVFGIVYLSCLWRFGLRKEEKAMLFGRYMNRI